MATTLSPETQRTMRAPGPRGTADDRRTRHRLRELCDEVIASHRVAADRDLWTERERREAQTLLRRLAPIGRR